jgi:hypothetical protein
MTATFYYDSNFTLANVDKTLSGYSVTVDIRNKPIFTRPRQFYKGQELIVAVSPVTEFAYENFTLKFPFIRSLNQFFSAKATFEPDKVRLERDGVGVCRVGAVTPRGCMRAPPSKPCLNFSIYTAFHF